MFGTTSDGRWLLMSCVLDGGPRQVKCVIMFRLRGLCFIQDSSLYLDLPTVEVAISMVFYLMILILSPAVLLGVFGGSKLPTFCEWRWVRTHEITIFEEINIQLYQLF